MSDVLGTLRERGFVEQCTNEAALQRLLSTERVTYYCGFDCTADSLHASQLLPIFAMRHLQLAGHRPVAIIGGGTTMVGDPSGKTEMRQMMLAEQIEANGVSISQQLQRFLDLSSSSRGLFLNNADWLLPIKYVDFLRDIGRHFRVNEMLKTEAYRTRFERGEGLSFIEFNYQLLQAYDFLHLFEQHGCRVQIGGSDQWGNIVAGIDLVRRMSGQDSFGLTFPLLTTARGEKMGKSAGNAVWLAKDKTSPYDFYQYWINVDDRDVERFLAYFTFLPMDEVRRLGSLKEAAIREAKEILAYEVTTLTHGEAEAARARAAAHAAFGHVTVVPDMAILKLKTFAPPVDVSLIPTKTLDAERLAKGMTIVDLFVVVGLTASKGEARRLVEQGGAYVNERPITDIATVIDASRLEGGGLMLRSGKKKYLRVVAG